MIGFHCQWEGESVGDAWLYWWRSTNPTQRKLPLLVLWGVWLARNQAIFKDVFCSPALTGTLSVGIYYSFPEQIRAARPRRHLSLHIDKTLPWAFFDGAAQNNLCGGGAVLYLSDSHYFAMSLGLGGGTNNFAELMSLKLLLMFALEAGCSALNFYGDSMNVIQWINHTQECWNLRLAHIISNIRQLLLRFDFFSCQHVYREINQVADKASKEGLRLDMGTWLVTENNEGIVQSYFHRPFFDNDTQF